MRYHGEADVDESCRLWIQVFCKQKWYCRLLMEVVSHATPPHLLKVKINFNEAQKLRNKIFV